MRTIKIGDTIRWRGGFGVEVPKDAEIIGLALTKYPREKYGEEVKEVTEQQIKSNRVLFDLKNGHWCYSEQVELYPERTP